MKCPVCKTEIDMNITTCPQCGFNECNKTFINQQEASLWLNNVVKPFERQYLAKINSLSWLKAKMYKTRSHEDEQRFLKRFVEGVKNKEWINMPINGQHPKIEFVNKNIRGGYYLAIYSGMDGRVPGDSQSILTFDISRVIEIMYSNPRLLGIVFDPNKDPYCLSRKTISRITEIKDPRLQVKEWGTGIPEYSQNDLMTNEELLDFAMETLENNFLSENGYDVIDEYKGVEGFPNFVLRKEGQLYMMKVSALISPNTSQITPKDKAFYLEHSNKFNAKCLHASVTFCSGDPERAKRGIALCGDGYNVSIDFVEEI